MMMTENIITLGIDSRIPDIVTPPRTITPPETISPLDTDPHQPVH
jgi:hypothetical protein